MSNDYKKILVVSYSLPPYGGIGGRRWTKFGIELKKRGYDIQYLTPFRKPGVHQRWVDDFEVIKNDIHYFKSRYPSILQKFSLSITQKLAYRFWLNKIKLSEKGNYFDPSCLDELPLTQAVEHFIKKGYTTIISTGAPFLQLYYLAQLKIQKKDFKLIVDLRDPWTMQDWSYGFPSLTEERKKIEQERESFVMKTADQIITVLPRMTRDLSKNSDSTKFHTVFNGYDEQDIVSQSLNNSMKESIEFIFAGNLYDSALHHIQELVDALKLLKIQRPKDYERLKFNFYGRVPSAFYEMVKEESSIIHHGFISSSMIGQKIAEADVGMLFLIDGFNYSLSTKFFEYIAQNKPILLFAKSGETSEYITHQNLGWHFQKDRVSEIFNLISNRKTNNDLQLPVNFNRKQFSIQSLTDELEQIIVKQIT